eukprot:135233_1
MSRADTDHSYSHLGNIPTDDLLLIYREYIKILQIISIPRNGVVLNALPQNFKDIISNKSLSLDSLPSESNYEISTKELWKLLAKRNEFYLQYVKFEKRGFNNKFIRVAERCKLDMTAFHVILGPKTKLFDVTGNYYTLKGEPGYKFIGVSLFDVNDFLCNHSIRITGKYKCCITSFNEFIQDPVKRAIFIKILQKTFIRYDYKIFSLKIVREIGVYQYVFNGLKLPFKLRNKFNVKFEDKNVLEIGR